MPAEFKIKLAEKSGREILERQPRYNVLLNDQPVGELYYNMTGYVGYLPTICGGKMDIGERGISAYRKEAARLNNEAAAAIKAHYEDDRRIVLTRPTNSSGDRFVISDDGLERQCHILRRSSLLLAESLFGKDAALGLGFFRQEEFSSGCVVQLFEDDEPLLAEFPDLNARILDPTEEEEHYRYIERVFPTIDSDTLLIVCRRIIDEADPLPFFVSAMSYQIGLARYGKDLRFADVHSALEAPVIDPAARSYMKANFPWLDTEKMLSPSARAARLKEISEDRKRPSVALTAEEREEVLRAAHRGWKNQVPGSSLMN